MFSTRHILAVAAFTSISACGGGGGGTGGSGTAPPPAATTQSVGGVWTSQYTVTSGANAGDVINAKGIVSENGQYFLYSKNTNNGCAGLGFGQLSVSGSTVSGDEDFVLVQYSTAPGVTTNCVYPDGSTSGTGTVDGSVTQQESLTVTATGTTSLGTALPSDTTTWSFSNLYLNPSSLATIAGNYSDGGPTLSIDANGVIFEQDAKRMHSERPGIDHQRFVQRIRHQCDILQLHWDLCKSKWSHGNRSCGVGHKHESDNNYWRTNR